MKLETIWGPDLLADGCARFRLWAPDCNALSLEIVADGRDRVIAMSPHDNGWFEAEAVAEPGARYRFRLESGLAVPDPASRAQWRGVHGWSVLVDPGTHEWRCGDWRGRPWEEAVVMEVHAGLLGGFAGVAANLERWRNMGVTAIELMPIAAFSGSRNWGYDGVLPYAVAESYGTPDQLRMLVDRAHELGLMVFLDVVYNHFGPDGNCLGAYAKAFFDQHADTPWGAAVAVSREPVRRFLIENALMWLGDYRIDGLRFDAVHAIGDAEFLDEMARESRATFAGRDVHLILENEGNDADRLRPGRFDAQWNDDFHNVLHVMLTGETEGYYEAFADDPTARLARCLAEGFIYQGEDAGRGARGKPSGHLPASAFVSFLQNHDQIGNRAMGERLLVLADPARLRVAVALMLLCPQIPMLFMGEEVGSRSPFLFFTDFHDDLADAVRNGRRAEFAKFKAFADPEMRRRIPDPNALSTFEASKPAAGPYADAWGGYYRELIALRRKLMTSRLRGALGLGAEVLGDRAVSARWRMADGASLAIALNLGDSDVRFPPDRAGTFFALGEPGAPASFAAWGL